MPKRKACPKKLSELQRREENYCFGGCAGPSDESDRQNLSEPTDQPVSVSKQKLPATKIKKSKPVVVPVRVEHVEGLEGLLEDSKYYVAIKRNPRTTAKKENDDYCLGNLNFKIHEHCIKAFETLPECDEFWLYASPIPGRSMLYFEWFEENGTFKRVKYFTLEGELDVALYNIPAKQLTFELVEFDSTSRLVNVSVLLRRSAILTPDKASTYDKGVNVTVQHIMKQLYNICTPDYASDKWTQQSRDDTESLYAVIKSYHESELKTDIRSDIEVQHSHLKVQLRPYQRDSVHWMLRREALLHNPASGELHPLYREVVTPAGKILFYHLYLGIFIEEKPTCKPPTPGGILADEMGLGKTVEVLSCMLANPRTDLVPDEFERELKKTGDISVDMSSGEGTSKENLYLDQVDNNGIQREDGLLLDKCGAVKKSVADVEDSGNSYSSVLNQSVKTEEEMANNVCDQFKVEEFSTEAANTKAKGLGKKQNSKTSATEQQVEKGGGRPKRVVRFADQGPAIINFDEDSDDDTSDVSWDGENDRPKKKKKKTKTSGRKTSKVPAKKPIKRLNQKAKSILIRTEKKDPIDVTIDKVIEKYCGKRTAADNAAAAKKILLMVKRNALFAEFNSLLASYSTVNVLHDKNRKKHLSGFFNEKVARKSLFECICGAEDLGDGREGVKCSQCSVWQHAECVLFDKQLKATYFCPHCWQLQPKVPSRATLIVAPASISQQWMDEIQKLIIKKGIKVKFYSGVHGQGFIQPRSLADNDIIITSYETLCKELDYVDLPHCNAVEGRKFRNAKRYMALPSPLPCIQWWRVCLDEAQMVECTTTRTAEMALRLAAVHRWCITGTPVQKSITDLFGLILFLGVDPYCQFTSWVQLLQSPYSAGDPSALYSVLCPLMWRTSKVDVLSQIQIPEQKEVVHWINFSPVEEHFYRRQHVQCANVVLNRISQVADLNIRLQKLRKDVLCGIINPLLGLRQACCHPQAVKGQFISLNKTTLTMEELLQSLIKKAKTECEESFRQVVSALNGLGGVSVIREEWRHAVEIYREVLMLVEENKEKIKADRLQKIHTMHNLAEILESHPDLDIPRTLRDSTLRQEASDLEKNYLNKCIAGMEGAKQSLEPLTQSVEELQEQLLLPEAWWSLVLQWAQSQQDQAEVVERVRQVLQGRKRRFKAMMYNKVDGILTLLLEITEDQDELRGKLLKEMLKLQTDPQKLVNMAVECHLRTMPLPDVSPKKKKKCELCKTSEMFEEYEKILFREEQARGKGHELVENNVQVFGKLNRIVWAEGEVEMILKALLGYAKLKKADEKWIHDGNINVKLMDAKKKEFKHLRIYWRQLNDHISALDELNMCKLRLRLRFPHEPSMVVKRNNSKATSNKHLKTLSNNIENKVENIYIIEEHEVETHALRLATERSSAQGDLRRRMGQLQYLENLQRDGIGHNGGLNPELCPICRKALGEKWSVLLCGHCYCIECLQQLRKHQLMRSQVNCPVCREITAMSEISYVNTCMQQQLDTSSAAVDVAMETEQAAPDTSVLGRNSAKAEAVVLALKNILNDDPDAKALVFSTWTSMLLVLARALRDNGISFAHIETGKKFQEALKLFKDPTKKVTALLLPVHSGANGLNLIEATHVLLVEPILNPASELQALGRVHRIGQTKPTVVHRFVVRGTIEERMNIVLKAHKGNTHLDEDPVTLKDLYNMFSTSSSDDPNPQIELPPSELYEMFSSNDSTSQRASLSLSTGDQGGPSCTN